VGREYLILWAGRHQRRNWEELCARYRDRIRRTVPVREVAIRARGDGGSGGGERRARAEGEAILAALPDPVWLVALDPAGTAMTSEALAAELARLRREWPHPIAFALGSDEGLAPAVIAASRQVLSLGPMTLSHELARLVLYEQLFRAHAIEAGSRYHR
jgi:23S rRNA (pseudouridine1915-N3)-methyltransferase